MIHTKKREINFVIIFGISNFISPYCFYKTFSYLGESKVLQFFCNTRHNPMAPDTFAEIMKLLNNTGL